MATFPVRGAPVDFDATTLGRPFTYHELASVGARAELVGQTAPARSTRDADPAAGRAPDHRVGMDRRDR